MTLVPECVLAREAEICYACIATVTDYDVWKDHPVSAGEVRRIMKANIEKVKSIISEAVSQLPKERKCDCKDALNAALI
jgi:5'-methylthioadenosine phosphorylase